MRSSSIRRQITKTSMWIMVLQNISCKMHAVKAVRRSDSIKMKKVAKVLKIKY